MSDRKKFLRENVIVSTWFHLDWLCVLCYLTLDGVEVVLFWLICVLYGHFACPQCYYSSLLLLGFAKNIDLTFVHFKYFVDILDSLKTTAHF